MDLGVGTRGARPAFSVKFRVIFKEFSLNQILTIYPANVSP